MVKFGCGILMLVLGAALALWLAYNLLIERQREFVASVGGLVFLIVLFFVGFKWVREGWPNVEGKFRPKPRRKKRTRRAAEDDDE